MKNCLKRLFCIAFLFSAFQVPAQDLTGIWRGYFYTETGEQYKYEMQIDQKRSALSGVTYSYLDTRFYGKAELAGNYARSDANAIVQELRTVELKMGGSSVACVMRCILNYSRSGKEEFLEGSFSSKYEKSNPIYGISRGGNCGGGKVFLRKVPTSDFELEPFLSKQSPRSTKPAPQSEPKKQVPVQKEEVVQKTERPRVENIETADRESPTFKSEIKRKINPTPVITRERKNELVKTLVVDHDEVEIRLYDNGEVDDDTISVYLNDRVILSHKRLSEKPIIYKLKLTEEEPEHILVMVAENLGRIPPNTSLMIVQDGDKRYQVGITSTEQQNAMVRFRYQKKD